MTWKPGNKLVYVIEAIGLNVVKIGVSNDIAKRLSMLQVGCPAALRLVLTIQGDETLEQELHARFAKYRVRGEWFLFADEILHLHDSYPPATVHVAQRWGLV